MEQPKRTVEPQYDVCVELAERQGFARLGLMSNFMWENDPRRLAIFLARYKFVAKMLAGPRSVLEVGCGDGFGSRVVRQSVGRLTAVDFDPAFIADAQAREGGRWDITFQVHDALAGPVPGTFDAAYGLDVLEHIPKDREATFIGNVVSSLSAQGVAIFGMPSLESQVYASAESRAGHVNCKSGEDLRESLHGFFYNVFIFSMNDEVVHTGFYPMAHYLLALGTDKRTS